MAAVSLVAVAQMTSHVSRTGSVKAQAAGALTKAGQLRPGDRIAVTSSLDWTLWVPQAFEVSWTEIEPFTPGSQPLPPGTTVVEAAWPTGQPGPGRVAASPGGLADRRLRSDRWLGRLAQGLSFQVSSRGARLRSGHAVGS